MYKYLWIFLVFLFLSGCVEDKGSNKFEQIPETPNTETGASLGNIDSIVDLNSKDIVATDRKKCYDIWLNCNNTFDSAIRDINNKRFKEIKNVFTENIKVDNGRIYNMLYTPEVEFKLPDGEYDLWQSFYDLSDNDTVFNTCYIVRYKDGRNFEGCYVRFIYKEGKWYIDHISIDVF
jgi:hypothetical protein